MSGIDVGELTNVMDVMRLMPRLVYDPPSTFIEHMCGEMFPLNARVRMVHNFVRRVPRPLAVTIADKDRKPISLDEPLLRVLARTENELYILISENGPLEPPSVPGDNLLNDAVDRALSFEPLSPMILDGFPSDLTREVQERIGNLFPDVKIEIITSLQLPLEEDHTIRYLLTGPMAKHSFWQPYFAVLPHRARVLQITLEPGVVLSLESDKYKFDENDQLVVEPSVYDAVEKFSPRDVITSGMLAPMIGLLSEADQAKARSMSGQQLIDFLTAEFSRLPERLANLLRALTTLPPSRASEPLAQRLAANNIHIDGIHDARAPAAVRQPRAALVFNRVRRNAAAYARIVIRKLDVVRIIVMKAVLWLYRNNIANVLIYTVAATAVSQTLKRDTNVIYLLWVYTFLAVVAAVVQVRKRVNIIERLVLAAYPRVYPAGDTPAEVLHAVPEASVRAAVASATGDTPVNYDTIVQDMVIKPPWWQVAAVCVGSLDPVSYKEWSKQVRERRSLAYDAARLAVTKQQQIGL